MATRLASSDVSFELPRIGSLVGNVRYWLSFQKISSGQDWSPSRQ
ncbi:MAG: hypothetical protein WAM03_09450 [Pseudolabrys sp.]|jgi:hypothetical protein